MCTFDPHALIWVHPKVSIQFYQPFFFDFHIEIAYDIIHYFNCVVDQLVLEFSYGCWVNWLTILYLWSFSCFVKNEIFRFTSLKKSHFLRFFVWVLSNRGRNKKILYTHPGIIKWYTYWTIYNINNLMLRDIAIHETCSIWHIVGCVDMAVGGQWPFTTGYDTVSGNVKPSLQLIWFWKWKVKRRYGCSKNG